MTFHSSVVPGKPQTEDVISRKPDLADAERQEESSPTRSGQLRALEPELSRRGRRTQTHSASLQNSTPLGGGEEGEEVKCRLEGLTSPTPRTGLVFPFLGHLGQFCGEL